ncbi:MAG: C_GCAxxG_C_C family protein, partial [Deltaproteobacteria bacterium]|nr:C_GCAxxG_C_C family protein [Deltaproteobacteria bacterium]
MQHCSSIHCARNVLESVRERTGIGNDRLERLSIVFDGGVGLRGVLCGALSGAILALNLLHGFNLRRMSYSSNFKKFLVGHINKKKKKSGRS